MGCHLLDVMVQGFDPNYTIADGGSGLRAGQKAAMSEIPYHGDVFHSQHQLEQVANGLIRRVQGGPTRLLKQAQQMANTNLKEIVAQELLSQQLLAEQREKALVCLAQDVKTLLGWFSHDVLALAGPSLAVPQELFDFIVRELQQREDECYPAIRKLRKALRNQRDQLLAFSAVLDQKLLDIAECFKLLLQAVRKVCLLHRKHKTFNAYWQRWNQLHSQLSGKFHDVMEAVSEALKETPRASSMVENLNSRLRNYFFLRRSLGDDYLSLAAILFESLLLYQVAEARTGGQKSQATADRRSSSPLAGAARLRAVSESVESTTISGLVRLEGGLFCAESVT